METPGRPKNQSCCQWTNVANKSLGVNMDHPSIFSFEMLGVGEEVVGAGKLVAGARFELATFGL
jgi:hypothetical protein